MNKAEQLLDLINEVYMTGLQPDVNNHVMQTFLRIRAGVLGVHGGDVPWHPDTVSSVYDMIGSPEARLLQTELGISKDVLNKWMDEIAHAVYNGLSLKEVNAIGAKHGIPAIPDTEQYANVPDSFNRIYGPLGEGKKEPYHRHHYVGTFGIYIKGKFDQTVDTEKEAQKYVDFLLKNGVKLSDIKVRFRQSSSLTG